MNNPENKSTIIIGDIHGRTIWKDIIARHPDDEIIFVGDYFDSKENLSHIQQIKNFNEILALKKAKPHLITLLFGNHDFHYLPQADETYSGFQHAFALQIRHALQPAIHEKLFEVCVNRGKVLICHAGLTRTWCGMHKIPVTNPVNAVNTLFYKKPEAFRFSPGPRYEPTGNEPEQGPLWVRPASLYADNLPGFTQIVGHTQRQTMLFLEGLVVVDVLAYSSNYLEINSKGNMLVHNCHPNLQQNFPD